MTIFGQSGLNFWDYFRTVLAEFLRLFSDSSNRIFVIVFGQSRTVLRFGFNPGIDVFRFYCMFWYHRNL